MRTSNGIAGSYEDPPRQGVAPREAKGLWFRRLLPPLAVAALLASAGAATFTRWSDTFHELSNSLLLDERSSQAPVIAEDQAQATRFFAQQAAPILEETARKNRDAIARAQDTLGQSIDRYRGGIDPFIADLRSWSTTYHIFLKSVVGWWRGDASLANYVDGRFRRHLFSDQSMVDDVRNALVQFDEDLEANRNQLLVNLQTASAASGMATSPKWPTMEAFGRAVSERVLAAMEPSARASVVSNVLASSAVDAPTAALLPAVVASAAKAAATAVMRAAATSASETVLAEGGIVVADAGSGGALGSEVPVIGNAVGFCAGLVVFRGGPPLRGRRAGRKAAWGPRRLYRRAEGRAGRRPRRAERACERDEDYVREIDRGESDLVKQAIMEPGKQP